MVGVAVFFALLYLNAHSRYASLRRAARDFAQTVPTCNHSTTRPWNCRLCLALGNLKRELT